MSTNYVNAFIEISADCQAEQGIVPPRRDRPTVAQLQFDLLADRPYELTSDELLFTVHALRTGVAESDMGGERARFFAKDQACLRASPLSKTYGWGTHHDGEGRVALYAVGTSDYERLRSDAGLSHKSAMRSRR